MRVRRDRRRRPRRRNSENNTMGASYSRGLGGGLCTEVIPEENI